MAARLLLALPGFLRRPVSLDEARQVLRRRHQRREQDFLRLIQRTVYRNRSSPYRQLLRFSGCEYGDLERLVQESGLENALKQLYGQGVYLTVDEMKGRRAVIRGSETIKVDPILLRNPLTAQHLLVQSGGSRGPRTVISRDLSSVRADAVHWRVVLEARGCARGPHALWVPPGGQTLINIFESAAYGSPFARWFAQVEPTAPGLHPRYRWSMRLMKWAGYLSGVPLPEPEYVPLDDPLPVARWMVEQIREGHRPHVVTQASSALRICQAAEHAGIDLSGTAFTTGSEPLTPARLAAVSEAGAEVMTLYSSSEAGPIAYGCLARTTSDDAHLFSDTWAVIQPGSTEEDRLPPRALLLSSLRPGAPMVMLNVSLGDQADLVTRSCGCGLDQYGWATHLENIRSFEKLNPIGVTLLDRDIVAVLEEVLPARFGGGPIDYQLVEEESTERDIRLRLLVHPRVGPLDQEVLLGTFLEALGFGSGTAGMAQLQQHKADFVQVERRPPIMTEAGKLLAPAKVKTHGRSDRATRLGRHHFELRR